MSEVIISREEAEELTGGLGQIHAGSWRVTGSLIRLGVPKALGLTNEEWVGDRLGGTVKLSIDERREAVGELSAEGMTQRAIAAALGVAVGTVNEDLSVQNRTLEPETPSSELENVQNRTPEEPDADELAEEVMSTDFRSESDSEVAEQPEPKKGAHVSKNSGNNEWYTPVEYIKAAVAVMGGIDLDPASNSDANDIVGAAAFYTAEDDGLTQPWSGRMWMNPPYAQPLVDRFCARMAREYASGIITAACVLVNNATETAWFQTIANEASAICFPRGRVKFWHPAKTATAMPLQGQAVLFLGSNVDDFKREFLPFGFVMVTK